MLGRSPPRRSASPASLGPRWIELLATTECPALTARRARRGESSGASQDPIVWREAVGSNVVDVDGNVYVDFTSGFGVAALGHRPPEVVAAVREQAGLLLHALGDVHPSDTKIALLEALSQRAPFPDACVILGAHGGDAIEAALKSALLATKRPGVLAFEGGYHGLAHGPLAACGYSEAFRAPFQAQLNPHVRFAPYPGPHASLDEALSRVDAVLGSGTFGAVLVEPMLGRGGVVVPPRGFLAGLAERTRAHGALLVVDEIFTGFHRTGPRFAFEEEGVVPDLLCLGKALGGGLPISACLGPRAVLSAWGDPSGEALHTATFFGHPLACAAALAQLDLFDSLDVRSTVLATSQRLREGLQPLGTVRGKGLSLGLELGDGGRTLRLVRALLDKGYLTLPAGPHAEVLQLAPPLTIDGELVDAFVATLGESLREVS